MGTTEINQKLKRTSKEELHKILEEFKDELGVKKRPTKKQLCEDKFRKISWICVYHKKAIIPHKTRNSLGK